MHSMTSNLPTLPDGWEWKKLGDIAEKIFAGGDKPEKYSEIQTEEYNIPIYANGIKDNGLFGYTDIHKVEEECLTISARGTIGFSAVRNEKFFPIVRLIVLIPKKNILSAYLKYYFDSQITDNTGSSIPQLTVPMVKSKAIPIPPLNEQKRLVSLLDTLFAKIDRSIELLDENIAAADALLPSALNTVFGELENEPKKYLKDITSKIGSGATPSGGEKAYKESGISLIRSMNVHDYGFRDKNLAFIDDQQAQKLNNVVVEENDVLLNITGASVARCCIVDSQYLPARVNQHVAIIRLKNQALPQFVHYYLISPNTKNNLLFNAGGGATREAITKKMIEEFEIPLPPLDIQNETVAYLDNVRDKVEMLKKVQNDKKSRLVALKASILDRAFKGEL